MDDLIVLLKVLNLLHDLFENFGAVLWRIAVFYKADMNESVLTSGAVSFFFYKNLYNLCSDCRTLSPT